MKNKRLLTVITITVFVTFGLTKLWDFLQQDKNIHENLEIHDEDEEYKNQNNQRLQLSVSELREFDILIDSAGPGYLQVYRDLPGEIVIDPDRLAHIIPRFPGIVKEVRKNLGEPVEQGEVLAIVESNESLVPYEVRSLISGNVIELHLTEGEVIGGADHSFVVADLSEVWVNLSVYQKDLPYIKPGQSVEIDPGPGFPGVKGIISYVSPILDEHTRTATARVILSNPEGYLRPGLFITGQVLIEEIDVPILVPKTALQTIEAQTVIFVQAGDEFKSQPVHTGRMNEIGVEILDGIHPGQRYISRGSFTLKAQLAKESFGEGHAH